MFVLEGVLILTILMSLDAVTDRGTAVDILNRLALVDCANRTYERSLDPSSIGFPIGWLFKPGTFLWLRLGWIIVACMLLCMWPFVTPKWFHTVADTWNIGNRLWMLETKHMHGFQTSLQNTTNICWASSKVIVRFIAAGLVSCAWWQLNWPNQIQTIRQVEVLAPLLLSDGCTGANYETGNIQVLKFIIHGF